MRQAGEEGEGGRAREAGREGREGGRAGERGRVRHVKDQTPIGLARLTTRDQCVSEAKPPVIKPPAV